MKLKTPDLVMQIIQKGSSEGMVTNMKHSNDINRIEKEQEQELVLLLSQFKDNNFNKICEIISNKPNWIEVLGYLMFHRIAGLAYHVLNQIEDKYIPGQVLFGLERINESQFIRTENNKKYIKLISKEFKEKDIHHAFLKGAVLANTLYPKGCRASNDIDILVSPKSISTCGKILESVGFIQGWYDKKSDRIEKYSRREVVHRRMNWGEVASYLKVVDDPVKNVLVVDINFSLDWLPTGTEDAVEGFLNNTNDYIIDKTNKIPSLDKESFLIHLCIHLYKECILYDLVQCLRDLDFYKYVDIYAYIMEYKIDWKKFILKCEKYNLTNGCYFALEYTRTFFPSLNNDKDFMDTLNKIKPDDTSYLNEVIDPPRPDIKYVWQEDILTRFFDMKRYEKIKEIEV